MLNTTRSGGHKFKVEVRRLGWGGGKRRQRCLLLPPSHLTALLLPLATGQAITIRWERDDGGNAAAAARTAACRRMIKQGQLEQRELEMSRAAKRLYRERCAVSGAAGLALEQQDTPARPAPGSSLSYPGYCDKTQTGEGNCDVSNKGSLAMKPLEGMQVRPPSCHFHPSTPPPYAPPPLRPYTPTPLHDDLPHNKPPLFLAAQACLDKCRACARCNYITFSEKYSDCSWYHSCDMTQLQSLPGDNDESTFATVKLQCTPNNSSELSSYHPVSSQVQEPPP